MCVIVVNYMNLCINYGWLCECVHTFIHITQCTAINAHKCPQCTVHTQFLQFLTMPTSHTQLHTVHTILHTCGDCVCVSLCECELFKCECVRWVYVLWWMCECAECAYDCVWMCECSWLCILRVNMWKCVRVYECVYCVCVCVCNNCECMGMRVEFV